MKRIALCFAVALSLSGCGNKNVHFVNTPVPPLPVVIPDPNEFKLAYSVQNDSNQTYDVHALQVRIHATYFTSQTCMNDLTHDLPRLEPGQKIVETAVEFEKNTFAGDPCACMKGNCNGFLTLSLTNPAGVLKAGPKTKFQITWVKSGDIAELSVVDLSD